MFMDDFFSRFRMTPWILFSKAIEGPGDPPFPKEGRFLVRAITGALVRDIISRHASGHSFLAKGDAKSPLGVFPRRGHLLSGFRVGA